MTANLWISRKDADDIYNIILTKPAGVHIYLVNAPAGVGKTYLARDIGTRLGSETGYEPGHKDDKDIYWSGIIDLYYPDTNNSRHIETAWKNAFSDDPDIEFREYAIQRSSYLSKSKQGTLGTEMKNQLQAVRKAFVAGMETIISKNRYPVMAFDTVERLRTVLDPAQERLDIEEMAVSDVFEWLLFQIENLSEGVILMMGRPARGLQEILDKKIKEINLQRLANKLELASVEVIHLEYLSAIEMTDFYLRRIDKYPELKSMLTGDIKALLSVKSRGNPLLLDIALQTLREANNKTVVQDALTSIREEEKQMEVVENVLLSAYMNSISPKNKQFLLTYLSIARNGLFKELLQHLVDVEAFLPLYNELLEMSDLPFVKVRDIGQSIPGQENRTSRKTFFLHDAMYEICDRVHLVSTSQLVEESKKISEWYDAQINQKKLEVQEADYLYNKTITELLVESLPYRMRTNPQKGYEWYLDQSDQAIQGISRGRDACLRDAMAQFFGSAAMKKTAALPANIMDDEILKKSDSKVDDYFRLDSALQWVKRYSIWGEHEKALDIAEKAVWVKQDYSIHPERYYLTYTEFLLWQGQSLMYSGKSAEAIEKFKEAIDILQVKYPIEKNPESIQASPSETQRACFIIGRSHNNRGCIFWYAGRYRLAIEEFRESIKCFEEVGLKEEIANAKDNIGRVYILLGYSDQAFESIREGLRLRVDAGLPYREALSRNSLAIALARFNNGRQALDEIEHALGIFRTNNIMRGVALSHFTRGVTLRRNEGKSWADMDLTVDDAIKQILNAENELRDALDIFTNKVKEPIRKVRIYNELACNYRNRHQLLVTKNDIDEQRKAFRQGLKYFEIAINEAKANKFDIEELDNYQDRAVLYANDRQFEKAREDLQTVRKQIPLDHQIQPKTGLSLVIPLAEQIDVYYKLMGQVEQLTGAMICEENLPLEDKEANVSEEVLLSAMEHYMLAVAYFNAFSGETFTNSRINYRIYEKLRGNSTSFLLKMRGEYLPQWLQKYNLPPDLIKVPFDEIFGLLIPGGKGRRWR